MVEAPICGFYRMDPQRVGDLTMSELRTMCDGMDWMNDRTYEHLIFAHLHGDALLREMALRYPKFKQQQVTFVAAATRANPKKLTFGG